MLTSTCSTIFEQLHKFSKHLHENCAREPRKYHYGVAPPKCNSIFSNARNFGDLQDRTLQCTTLVGHVVGSKYLTSANDRKKTHGPADCPKVVKNNFHGQK